MAGWKSRLGRGHTATVPQPASEYHVSCRCGCELSGERLPRFQVLECGECGARVFVLPEDPYPAPEESEIPTAALVVPARKRKRKTPNRPHTGNGSHSTRSIGTEKPQKDAPDLTLTTRPRLITPFRVILLVMIGIASATGYAIYQRSQQQQAERDFREHTDAGLAAMKDGDFPHAATELELAIAALERLDRDDEQARHVLQMARECRAASDLMLESLPELLDNANRLQTDAEAWEQHFRRVAAGKWVVLDTSIQKVVDKHGTETYRIDYPLFAGTQEVELDGSLPVFERVDFDQPIKPVIVALQLESIRTPGNASESWVVQFNRESAFLWTDYDNLRALGFSVAEPSPNEPRQPSGIPTEEQLRRLLAAQSRAMGVTE